MIGQLHDFFFYFGKLFAENEPWDTDGSVVVDVLDFGDVNVF